MKALGVDYGRAKIGLAVAEGRFAGPLGVVKVKGWEDALEKVSEVSKVAKVSKVVVGVSEGEMGEEQERFAHELSQKIDILVETQDESLSTLDAQEMAIQAGIPQKKRQKMEDAFAAAVMLQSWIDCSSSR